MCTISRSVRVCEEVTCRNLIASECLKGMHYYRHCLLEGYALQLRSDLTPHCMAINVNPRQ